MSAREPSPGWWMATCRSSASRADALPGPASLPVCVSHTTHTPSCVSNRAEAQRRDRHNKQHDQAQHGPKKVSGFLSFMAVGAGRFSVRSTRKARSSTAE